MRIAFWGGPRHKEIAEIETPNMWTKDGYELHKINLAFREGLSSTQYYGVQGFGAQDDRAALGDFLVENGLGGTIITHEEMRAQMLKQLMSQNYSGVDRSYTIQRSEKVGVVDADATYEIPAWKARELGILKREHPGK